MSFTLADPVESYLKLLHNHQRYPYGSMGRIGPLFPLSVARIDIGSREKERRLTIRNQVKSRYDPGWTLDSRRMTILLRGRRLKERKKRERKNKKKEKKKEKKEKKEKKKRKQKKKKKEEKKEKKEKKDKKKKKKGLTDIFFFLC